MSAAEKKPLMASGVESAPTTPADDNDHDEHYLWFTDHSANDEPHLLGHRFANLMNRLFTGYARNANIDQAWLYFERITLPRRMTLADGNTTKGKASPGSPHTRLYAAWGTPQRELIDFGTGIAVYFETLRACSIILLIAGCLYIPTFVYYRSDEFNNGASEDNVFITLRGSLICASNQWVPCPDCTLEDWSDNPARYATGAGGLIFALKNTCAPLRWNEGINHLIVLTFLVVAIVGLGWYQRRTELKYDEAVLTASDYSIQVDNPPKDATDPDEWKEFMSQFGKVAYITVAMNNQQVVQALIARRAAMQKAWYRLKAESDHEGEDVEWHNEIPESLAETSPKLYAKLMANDEKCKALLATEKKYDTSAIFVTFDTEKAQRAALNDLRIGQVYVQQNDTTKVNDTAHLFRGNLVLDVSEAIEPSAIRWQDLDETLGKKILERIVSGFLTVFVIVGGFLLVQSAYEQNLATASIEITLLNILMPHVFKFINRLESHQKEGAYQASLYMKITVFRWINTAVVTTMIKPLTVTLEDGSAGLIPAVHAVLRAEIMIAPIVHMLDIMGHIKRDLLAPWAANQAAMNSFFYGSRQNLGEKFTNMTKTVFLCFFYSVIFPSSFFYGALSLFLIYHTDKFLLLRSWGPIPQLGNQVAQLSRRFFFPAALISLAIMSEFYWSAYPFDNLCETDTLAGENGTQYVGSHDVAYKSHDGIEKTASITVTSDDDIYRFCSQDFLENWRALFHFFREERNDWMSPAQDQITFIFGIACVVIFVVMTVVVIRRNLKAQLEDAVMGGFTTEERDSGERYSMQEKIMTYVPQVRRAPFAYPLLACDLDMLDTKHIGWDDPVRSYDFYNLANDVKALGGNVSSSNPVLSVVKHYSTEEKKAEEVAVAAKSLVIENAAAATSTTTKAATAATKKKKKKKTTTTAGSTAAPKRKGLFGRYGATRTKKGA